MKKTLLIVISIVVIAAASLLFVHFYSGSRSVALGEVIRHPNGLSVNIPLGCEVRQAQAGGFQICTGRRSSPLFITVLDQVSKNISDLKTRQLSNGITAYYETSFSEGVGSGGDEYSIYAMRRVGDKWIVMRRVKQSELGHPGFKVEWAVLETAELAVIKE